MNVVLIVEDQPVVARLLVRWVETEGASPMLATSAEQALLLASERTPAVALCDVNLPGGRDGFWLAEQLRNLYPATAVVIATGLHQFDHAVMGLRAGVVDYVTKPVTRERLIQALRRALSEHQVRMESMAARNQRASQGGEGTRARAALLAVLNAQGGEAVHRAQRASEVAAKLARALGVSGSDLSIVEDAALLCHINRVDVHGLASKMPHLNSASAIALAAQERFDGTGFPMGLKEEAIPLGARILAVANAYDALVAGAGVTRVASDRAVDIICTESGTQFDPAVLCALKLIERDLCSTAA